MEVIVHTGSGGGRAGENREQWKLAPACSHGGVCLWHSYFSRSKQMGYL